MEKTVEQLKIMLQADVLYEKYLATRRYITMYDKVVKKDYKEGMIYQILLVTIAL